MAIRNGDNNDPNHESHWFISNTKCYASCRKVFSPKGDWHFSANIDDDKNSDIITTQFIESFKACRDNVKDMNFYHKY